MLERFARTTRQVVEAAQEEARALGSRTVEAEHLLLALARGTTPAAAAMADHGLDHDALVEALGLEEATALQVVGVSASAYGAPSPTPVAGHLRFATSAKRALEHTVRLAAGTGAARLEPHHVLLALLLAQEGTVPRALALSGSDVTALIRRTHELCRGR